MTIPDQAKQKMHATIEHFKTELKQLRTNRANPGMVEGVIVEVYGGTPMRIKELANITTPEARQLLLSPFDPQTTQALAKGIEKANLNLNPIVEGNVIRINVPPMDQTVRQDIVKQGKKKAEDAKITIRKLRQQHNELVRKEKANGTLTEDDMKKQEKIIQDLTDQSCKQIDDLFAAKEKEILAV